MTAHAGVQTSAWVERARALAPVSGPWRAVGEQARHLPHPPFELLRDAGVFRMSVSTAIGGAEVDDATGVRVTTLLRVTPPA
jgi:hypothetical protein